MAHVHYVLDTYGYKHTLTICNTYCFSTAKMVSRTHLHITLYVHCMSCLVCLCLPFLAILFSFGLALRCNAGKIYVERPFQSRFRPESILLFDMVFFRSLFTNLKRATIEFPHNYYKSLFI
jgi:hypothetical protein